MTAPSYQQTPSLHPPPTAGMMQIDDLEFGKLRDLIQKRFGIHLTEKKRSLVIGRLQKVVRGLGFENFSSYYDYVQKDRTGHALNDLVNRISTNYTYFWREPEHFVHLENVVLPELRQTLKKKNDLDIRLWCAAAATGEEPYMLAMILKSVLGLESARWKAGLLATDISDRALSIARNGIYPGQALSRMPAVYRNKYFIKNDTDTWRVSDEIRREVTYRRFNLMNPIPFRSKFHIIFCRNVMIYFDQPTKTKLIERFFHNMEPGGYLYIGHAESLDRKTCPFQYVQPALYKKGG